ncbi:MAG: protein phosphatase CheZ, partial [Woeseiaceae bacterium]
TWRFLMSSGLLPDHIEPLVDRLRSGDHLPISLPDVAAVTEVLMRSLESYFKSIDLTLYKECQDLADYIDEARSEISSLSSAGEDSVGIPRAGKELDAIVEATESATDTIMQAAEDLMSFESDDFDEYKDHINTEVMKIFEACSFQDITGQRISKVVKTLNHVEDRVGKLISILGITLGGDTPEDAKSILDSDNDEINDDDLLNGPALSGEGIDQSEIDSLLDGSFDQVTTDEPSPDTVAETQDEPVEADIAQPEPKIETSEEIAKDTVEVPVETQNDPVEVEITQPEPIIETTEEVAKDTVEVPVETQNDPVEAEITQPEPIIETTEEVAQDVVKQVVEEVAEEVAEVPVETIEKVTETDHKKPVVQEKVQAIPNKAEAANEPTKNTAEAAGEQKKTSQEDIDSLFG